MSANRQLKPYAHKVSMRHKWLGSGIKLAAKLSLAMFMVVGVCAFLSVGKVAAVSTGGANCPDSLATPSQNFGYHRGENDDGFAGLTVSARYAATYNDGTLLPGGQQNAPINTNFRLNSQLPNLPAGEQYIDKTGSSDTNINARIFSLDAQNPIRNTAGRTASHLFGTGTNIYTNPSPTSSPDNGPSFTCNGLTVLGPGVTYTAAGGGTVNEWGDRWALDCGEGWSGNGTSGQEATHFWISDIPKPAGQDGHWEILEGQPAPQPPSDFNYNGSNTGFGQNDFGVTNGVTQHVYLIWHPDKPPVGNPSDDPECTTLDVTDGGGGTINSKYFVHGDIRTLVRVTDTSGQVMVHGPGGQADFVYMNDESKHWDYTPKGRQVTVYVFRQYYHNTGTKDSSGNWIYAWDNIPAGSTGDSGQPLTGDETRTHTCYDAACSISVAGNVAGKPQGVHANQSIDVTVTVYNWAGTPDDPNGLVLPDNIVGAPFVFASDGGQTGGLGGINMSLPAIARAGSYSNTVEITAPGSAGHYHFSGSPVYAGSFYPEPDGRNCGADFDVYQQFGAGLTASTSLSPTDENPNSVNYSTTVSLSPSSPPVYIPTYSKFYKKFAPPSGVESTLADHAGGIYPNEAVWSGNYAIPSGSFSAGDQYCAAVHANYTSGWIGPNGPYDVAEPGPGGDSLPGCQKVTNKPFFKAYNSAISARNGISDPSGTCSATAANSGLLAGWNDNLDGPGNDRGSGTQLSSLALLKITGVASAQTVITRPPTDLTFANTNAGDITSSRENPSLGGNFGGTPTCTAPPTPKLGALNLAGNPAPLPPSGNYQHTGNLKISGGNINGSTAIFVNGDVYLNGNVTYNTAGWSPGNVPSLVIVATGNIYVDPGVTQLDGVFISQPSSPAAGGTVYTCATAISPTTFKVNSDFTACHNQLLVNGSFKADKVKLLRTFGSLRDDTPTGAAPGYTAVPIQWSSCGTYGSPVGGEACLPASGTSGLRCVHTDEPSEDSGGAVWADNILCVSSTSDLHLAWTHYDNNPGIGDWTNPFSGWAPISVMSAHGYRYCTRWDVPPDYPQTWYDNELCMDKARADGVTPLLKFVTNPATQAPGESCTKISEIADRDGQWTSGYYLCQPPSTIIPAHSGPFTSCSNAGVQMTTDTCAAEVFRFSPELYLTDPPTQPANKGATQYDAITSLPPVL